MRSDALVRYQTSVQLATVEGTGLCLIASELRRKGKGLWPWSGAQPELAAVLQGYGTAVAALTGVRQAIGYGTALESGTGLPYLRIEGQHGPRRRPTTGCRFAAGLG